MKAPLVFGGCVCGGDCYFDGFMDSVRAFDDIEAVSC